METSESYQHNDYLYVLGAMESCEEYHMIQKYKEEATKYQHGAQTIPDFLLLFQTKIYWFIRRCIAWHILSTHCSVWLLKRLRIGQKSNSHTDHILTEHHRQAPIKRTCQIHWIYWIMSDHLRSIHLRSVTIAKLLKDVSNPLDILDNQIGHTCIGDGDGSIVNLYALIICGNRSIAMDITLLGHD
eukprot:843159_1